MIVALAKNNAKENSTLKINLGFTEDKKTEVVWDLIFSWKTRIKTARMKVIINGKTYERLIQSYLLTKEELSRLLKKNGFKWVEIFTSPGIYDDILVGYK